MPIKLEHVLKRVQALPPLPTSALRVIALTKNPDTTVKDLETVISQDPSLAAGILRQANSAYYGYARRISSLQEAIVMLGFQVTQGLAMASAVAPLLKTNLLGYEIEQEGLWKHSMLTAMTAKRLCQYKKLPYGDTAFTAGLLHDIGKLVISVYVQEVGSFLVEKVKEVKLSYVELEEKVIGYNHAAVGGFLARSWFLPEDLVSPISYHHSPSLAPSYPELASVVHVANGLANLLGIGGGVDSLLNPIQQEALDRLSLEETDLEYLLADLGEFLVDPSLFS
ncbi:HDOD domain-containing protein [Desulfosporosinus youngiae]|uniref:Putative domain HDIG-containing protein n=1 Tax=Desulfosporosinus youngiae DSM 17734 TaxID=768710 RepID=H5Y0H1_9FIRM|nr:HDOD domain-containing protein [Desulfosporosinus youngiae]EHQ92227.1 putative domain HDIG-containing protein [Desulfosporosinus youngiae DSM 17734]